MDLLLARYHNRVPLEKGGNGESSFGMRCAQGQRSTLEADHSLSSYCDCPSRAYDSYLEAAPCSCW